MPRSEGKMASMTPTMLMNPGFFVRPLLDPAVARKFALISSRMVFEDVGDAALHLDALVKLVDPCLLALPVNPRPVRAHVPGADDPSKLLGYRLVSTNPAPVGAVAEQVEALNDAAARLGMADSDALESLSS